MRSSLVRPLPLLLMALAPAAHPAEPGPAAPCAAVLAAAECPDVTKVADGLGCTCEVERAVRGSEAFGDVLALRVSGQAPDVPGMIDTTHLVFVGAKGTYDLGEITSGFTPGAFGIYNEGQVLALDVGRVADLGEVVTVRTKNAHSDSDLGMNAQTASTIEHTFYCVLDGGAPACVELWTSGEHGVEKIEDDGEVPPADVYGPLGMQHYTRAVKLDAKGQVVVGKATGKVPDGLSKLAGTFSLKALLGRSDAGVRRPAAAAPKP